MLINPKSVQKSEIECKKVKLIMIDSSDKQNGEQKLNEDCNCLSKFQYNYLITKQSAKFTNND